jgi:hypothetical protein|tara:strand:- start:640 stop:1005 length:366 start_codon:yes stop_codon:yes gene_type:complete
MNLGEYSESLFATRCIEMGYIVSKPFSHYTRYDLVVDAHSVLQRVQVKSTDYLRKDNQCHVKIDYTKEEIDWFAIYFRKFDFWYVVPVEAVQGIKQLSTTIEGNLKYNVFKNNFGFVRYGF